MGLISPAKINLHLRVGPRAVDGFHPLLSWMCTVGLHDVIKMTASDSPGVRLTCDQPDVPTDETNLIVKAAKALDANRGAEVKLTKRIPMGGGMGGGSSNGATALVGFNRIWKLGKSEEELAGLAAGLGSDVPFFLHGASSVCGGRGERVTPIGAPAAKYVVLFFPDISMSTPAVYRRFDEMGLGESAAIEKHPDWNAWGRLPAVELMAKLVNDLEAPAFSTCRLLGELRTWMEEAIGHTVRMSGSGSTLFTLADTEAEAERIEVGALRLRISAEAHRLAPAPE